MIDNIFEGVCHSLLREHLLDTSSKDLGVFLEERASGKSRGEGKPREEGKLQREETRDDRKRAAKS